MKLYDLVKNLLEENPTLRDSDKLLIWKVWERCGYVTSGTVMRYENFVKATSTESIRRVRQKIQEQYPSLCSSAGVQAIKEAKRQQKGTHIYREPVEYVIDDTYEPDYDYTY